MFKNTHTHTRVSCTKCIYGLMVLQLLITYAHCTQAPHTYICPCETGPRSSNHILRWKRSNKNTTNPRPWHLLQARQINSWQWVHLPFSIKRWLTVALHACMYRLYRRQISFYSTKSTNWSEPKRMCTLSFGRKFSMWLYAYCIYEQPIRKICDLNKLTVNWITEFQFVDANFSFFFSIRFVFILWLASNGLLVFQIGYHLTGHVCMHVCVSSSVAAKKYERTNWITVNVCASNVILLPQLTNSLTLTANDELSFSLTCNAEENKEEEEQSVDLHDGNQGYTFLNPFC